MTLDEMESSLNKETGETEEAVSCEISPSDYDNRDERLEELADHIMKHFFGANNSKGAGRKGLCKILDRFFDDVEEIENDLAESLDLIETSLKLHEAMVGKHKHSPLRGTTKAHMVDLGDWLSNWGK